MRGIRRQVRRDRLPGSTLVGRAVDELRAVIDHVRVVGRYLDRRDPLEPVDEIRRVVAVHVLAAHPVLLLLPRSVVVAAEAALAVGVDDVAVGGLRHRRTRLAATHRAPERLGARRRPVRRQRGYGDGRVVLLAGVESVGERVVRVHLVQLRGGLVVLGGPGLTAIQGHIGAAVVRLDEQVRVPRVDPHVVVVTMGSGQPFERFPAVRRLPEPGRVDIDHVGVARVGIDIDIVEGAVQQRVVLAHEPEAGAAIVGPIQAAAGLRLDERVDPVGVRRRHRQVRLADQLVRKTVRQLPPRIAPVGRTIDPALPGARDDRPRLPLGPPHRRVDRGGIVGRQLQVGGPGGIRHEQDPLPAGPAVGRPVDPALRVGRERVADGGNEHDIGIRRVHDDRTDLSRSGQSDELPILAGVRRPVHADAGDHVAA